MPGTYVYVRCRYNYFCFPFLSSPFNLHVLYVQYVHSMYVRKMPDM